MPPLRKSQRKSRTSTPYATPYDTHSPSSDTKKEKTQSSLDGWIEPPLKNLAPSFEEHGFARHGVLETMAPLGVPPSAKVKQRARALADPTARRPGFGRNGNMLAGEDGVSTPEMTPAPEVDRDDSERQEDEDMHETYQGHNEDDDDDYVPKPKKGKVNAAKTPVRGKTPVQSKSTVHVKTPVRNGTSRPSTAVDSPVKQGAPSLPSDVASATAKQRITIAVNDAISRSKQQKRPTVGLALQQLHRESELDASIYSVLESIIHQNSTQDQLDTFRKYIKSAKKRIKREAKAHETVKDASAMSSPFFTLSPPPYAKPSKIVSPPKSAAPSGSAELNLGIALSSDSIDLTMEDAAQAQRRSTSVADSAQFIHPLTTVPSLTAKHSPSPHSSRIPSKSPRKQRDVNGDAATGLETDADVEASTKAPTPTAKTPDSVVGVVSDSDLSDVNEEIVQNGPPEPLQVNGSDEATAPVMKKSLAVFRGAGKKSRANSAKPNGRWEKRPQPTAENLAEEAELRKKRDEMAEQQPSRMHFNPPTSEMRYEDEMLETESLTESQIAVGPPIDSSRPRRTGRPSRTGMTLQIGKRLRDDNSALPSPQPDSAVTTRPSTPAVIPPAAKRLKLNNGQAARTKRSPVKNRDGPIAGIAHTGGGGSRQLGPDDNDPGSPPSESDDFCSACKGAGEFVCCDNCTRVYHFLCCDPPRQEPPTGSFLCHDCNVKLRPSEASSAESFTVLGPLLKQLESTNTRSFALPKDVQRFFENVSSRKDGSYHEEIKKFPLAKSSGYGYQRPDYLRTHDAEHKPILCAQCGKSSTGKRQMLKCDFCHAYWHLDCCDPPLANPPHISLEASQRDAWKCPRHIDHDFRAGLWEQADLHVADDDDVEMVDTATIRVTRKLRKPRHPSVVDPTFSRGTRNSGLIDIVNDPDDDTDGEGNYVYSPEDSKDTSSKVYRVPEKGIIADFITKVKNSRVDQKKAERRAAKAAARRKTSQQLFTIRPIEQQQAALHLAQLANREADIGLNDRSVDALLLSLTAEAPDDVVSAISNAGPGPLTETARTEMLKLRALIDRALGV